MRRNRGFSLIELLIGLALSVTLGLALLSFVRQFQNWNANLGLLMERDEQLRQAPLLLARYLAGAGNNGWVDRDGLETGAGSVRAKADLDGEEGFPDSRLGAAFETVTLRQGENDLQFQSGRGGFQPLLKNIEGFQPSQWDPPLLRLKVAARAGRELQSVGGRADQEIEVLVYVWNYRENLFENTRP